MPRGSEPGSVNLFSTNIRQREKKKNKKEQENCEGNRGKVRERAKKISLLSLFTLHKSLSLHRSTHQNPSLLFLHFPENSAKINFFFLNLTPQTKKFEIFVNFYVNC